MTLNSGLFEQIIFCREKTLRSKVDDDDDDGDEGNVVSVVVVVVVVGETNESHWRHLSLRDTERLYSSQGEEEGSTFIRIIRLN